MIARRVQFTGGGREMLRKTLVTLTAVAALSVGSTAFAMHGGGGGGHGSGGGWGGGGGGHGWGGGAGFAATRGATMSPAMHGPTGPMTTGRVQGWNGGRSNLQGWNGGRSNVQGW